MIEVEHKGRKVKITYRNDVIFKTTLGGNDEDSKELLKFVVEAVTGKIYDDLTVVNTELLGKFVLGKKNYLDIRAKDKDGNMTNIEMQQSDISEYDLKRFQGYAYRTVGNEGVSGESYDSLKPVDQIVFTTGKFESQLITEYKQRQKNGEVMKYNLASFYFVSLPFIEEIVKRKKVSNERLSNLEILSYIYQKEIDNDIISVSDDRQKRMIALMEKKYQEASINDEIFDEAKEAAYYESWFDAQLNHYLKKGYNDGMAQGLEKGLEEGIKKGIEKGIYENQLTNLHKLVLKIYNNEANWLNECTLEQLNYAFDLVFENLSYDEFRKKVTKDLHR